LGARPEDYEKSSPEKSYINVNDFEQVKDLADYLITLDNDDELYNSYFKWKGTGETINTFFWCRVCAMLHDEQTISKPKWYEDINEWWNGKGICIKESWRSFRKQTNLTSQI
jgi:glycoprotein 3-alpha-L-fucosyltransferase